MRAIAETQRHQRMSRRAQHSLVKCKCITAGGNVDNNGSWAGALRDPGTSSQCGENDQGRECLFKCVYQPRLRSYALIHRDR